MPRLAKELTALKVSKLTAPGLYAVGGVPGLHLQVTPTGARSWVARLTVGERTGISGKSQGQIVQHRRDFGLGSYPEVSLAEARDKARELRKKVADNIDPIAEKMEAKARAAVSRASQLTVAKAVELFIADMEAQGRWDGDKAGYSKRRAWLEKWIKPHIGGIALEFVTSEHAVTVYKAVRVGARSQEEKISSLLANTFSWAKAKNYAKGDNPFTDEAVKHQLTPRPKGGNMTALPYSEVPGLVADLRARASVTADALEFLILTAVRTSDVIEAPWSEINWDEKTWQIPKERRKGKKDEDRGDHVVPLTDDMLNVLRRRREAKVNDWIFPSPVESRRGAHLSDGSMLRMLQKDMGYTDQKGRKVTVHGFRSAFLTWASEETDHHPEVRKMAMSHKISNAVEAAYRRGTLLKKRRILMQQWNKFCGSGKAT